MIEMHRTEAGSTGMRGAVVGCPRVIPYCDYTSWIDTSDLVRAALDAEGEFFAQ